MCYTEFVEANGNGAFSVPRTSQSRIVGKVPPMCGPTSRRSLRHRTAAHGGRFAMPKGLERPQADCHPDQPHYAQGLCRRCYRANLYHRLKNEYGVWKTKGFKSEEEYKAYTKSHYLKNKEQYREWGRSYRVSNTEKEYLRKKKYRAEHPESVKQGIKDWRRRNPERRRQDDVRRRALEMNCETHATAQERSWRSILFGNSCAYCGGKYVHMDHLLALSRGGTDNAYNLIPSCLRCNTSKCNQEWHQWYRVQQFYDRKRERFIEHHSGDLNV